MQEARTRIERQAAIVAALDDGTEEHQRADRALSVLEKSLAAMIDADAIIAASKRNVSIAMMMETMTETRCR